MDGFKKALVLSLMLQILETKCSTVKTKVLILGGGAAGVGFASKLQEKGHTDFLILEAQSYIGGRIKDIKFGSLTIQEGANWIHGIGKDNSMYQLKQKYGLNATTDNYTDFVVRDLSGNLVPEAQATYNKLRKKIDELYNLVEDMQKKKELDIPVKTAFEIVGWRAKSPMERALDYYVNDFENEAPPKQFSAWSSGFTGGGTDELVTDQRGYAYVLREEAKSFQNKIHLKTVVKKISYNDKKVTVETSNGTKYEADYAYVTFSTGVLASSNVAFSPALPNWKMKAIYMLPMNHYTKIFLKFPTKFWDSNRYILIANENRGHYVHFMNLDRPGLFEGQKLLIATVTDVESERVEKLSDNQVKTEIYNVLRRVYPTASQPSAIFLSRWSLDNTTYGAYSSPVIGSDKYSYINLRAPVNKTLWFGGEAATDVNNFGYAHAAYTFGGKQADELLSCIKDSSKCPVYKPRGQSNTTGSSTKSMPSTILVFFLLIFRFCF